MSNSRSSSGVWAKGRPSCGAAFASVLPARSWVQAAMMVDCRVMEVIAYAPGQRP